MAAKARFVGTPIAAEECHNLLAWPAGIVKESQSIVRVNGESIEEPIKSIELL